MKLSQIDNQAIVYNRNLRKAAKIVLADLTKRRYETDDPLNKLMWQDFSAILQANRTLFDSGAAERGLAAFDSSVALESTDIMDLAAAVSLMRHHPDMRNREEIKNDLRINHFIFESYVLDYSK